MEEEKKSKRVMSKESMRKLRGWKDYSDEEFNRKYDDMLFGGQKDEIVQEKISRLYREFEAEYDLTSLLPNDRAVLKNLIQAMVLLDMYQTQLFNIMKKANAGESEIFLTDKLGKQCDLLTGNISKMQEDLKITRKSRKSEKEENTIQFIEDVKRKAKKFYEQKMTYVICPNCKTVLATVWFMYPQFKNTLTVMCHKEIDGKPCGTTVTIDPRTTKGSNLPEVLADTLK
jgi:RNase P subunit RPR2